MFCVHLVGGEGLKSLRRVCDTLKNSRAAAADAQVSVSVEGVTIATGGSSHHAQDGPRRPRGCEATSESLWSTRLPGTWGDMVLRQPWVGRAVGEGMGRSEAAFCCHRTVSRGVPLAAKRR